MLGNPLVVVRIVISLSSSTFGEPISQSTYPHRLGLTGKELTRSAAFSPIP